MRAKALVAFGAALAFLGLTQLPAAVSCGVNLVVGALQYSPFDPAGGSFSGIVEIDCSAKSYPAMVQVELDGGRGGDPAHRAMRSLRNDTRLRYQIYLPNGVVWGDGANGTSTLSTSITKAHTRIPFVALVFPGQTAPEDTYVDDLTATLDL